MSNPKIKVKPGKERDITIDLMMVFGGLIIVIFYALHIATVYGKTDGGILFALIAAMDNLMANPLAFEINELTAQTLLYSIVIYLFVLLLVKFDMDRHKRDPKAKGTAEWTTDIKKYNKQFVDQKNEFNNMILTDSISLNMDTHVTRRNNNVLVVGGSGAGKTRFLIKPNLLQANCSFVVTDPSGEIVEAEGEMLRRQGYDIRIFNLVDMKHSNRYNPFNYIRDDLGVMMLINCLIKNTNNGQKGGGDPFWEKSETALLQAIIFYLIKNDEIPPEDRNFTKVMQLLRMAQVDENNANLKSDLDKLFDKFEALTSSRGEKTNIAVNQYKTFKMGAGKTLKSILISCAVRLTSFNIPEIADLTSEDNIDLRSIGDKKTALFVIIPAADDTYNFLVSMMYSQLFETLYYRAENECPYERWIKHDQEVLAIVPKNEKGDNYTEEDAATLMAALKSSDIKKIGNAYQIKCPGFERTFYTKKLAEDFLRKVSQAEIVRGGKVLPYHVRFLLDEFSNIGQIPEFTKKLATMRKYEISCTIILQNLAQIKTMYKDDWESIVGNCDSFLFLGGQEYSTLEYISKLLGKETVISYSRGMSHSAKGGGSSENYGREGKEMLSTDRLSTMPKDECVLIINGLHPFYSKKYRLERHPNYKNSGDANPEYKFDYKKEIITSPDNIEQKRPSHVAMGLEPGINAFLGRPTNMKEEFEKNNIKTIMDASKNIVLKADDTKLVERIDDSGEVEFDYSL